MHWPGHTLWRTFNNVSYTTSYRRYRIYLKKKIIDDDQRKAFNHPDLNLKNGVKRTFTGEMDDGNVRNGNPGRMAEIPEAEM